MRSVARRDRRRAAVLGVTSVAIAAWIANACLPDLAVYPPASVGDGGVVIGSSARCGDGIVQTTDARFEQCDEGEAGKLPGCASCRLDCSEDGGHIEDRTGHCYFPAGATSTYAEARAACEQRGAHVVTLGGADELEFVTSSLGARVDAYWTGLLVSTALGGYEAANPEEPGWPYPPLLTTRACPGCYAPVRPTNEAGTFPSWSSDGGALEFCIAGFTTRADAGWLTVPCVRGDAGALGVVCEREPPGARTEDCLGGSCLRVVETLARKRYLLADQPVLPEDAPRACTQLGGRLVVFTSTREREQVTRELGRRLLSLGQKKVTFFIGLSRTAGKPWLWEDGADESAHPPVWGESAPGVPPVPDRAGRAFLVLGLALYDTALARADQGTEPPTDARKGVLCEFPL